MPQLLFGGLLAITLLGFYIWSIVDAIYAARMGNPELFKPNMSILLNTVGGLISATVVGVLGSTKPGEFPAHKSFGRNLTGKGQKLATSMPSLFILVWIGCGVGMIIWGFILYDNVPALNAQAKVWLGTAVGAVYAYMGVTPNGNGNKRSVKKARLLKPQKI